MGYIIATFKDGQPYAITINKDNSSFALESLDESSTLNKMYCHPHVTGAYNVLTWIRKNDEQLSCETLDVYDEARFRK